jgi:hypothetical protein
VDPRYFVDQQERELLVTQIASFSEKRRWLDTQRQKILSQRTLDLAAKDQDDLTFELLQDGRIQALNFIDASIQILTSEGSITNDQERQIRVLIGGTKALLNSLSAATSTSDSLVRMRKLADVATGIKDILPPYRLPGMSQEQSNAFRRALNIVPKLADISQRVVVYRRGSGEAWKDLG